MAMDQHVSIPFLEELVKNPFHQHGVYGWVGLPSRHTSMIFLQYNSFLFISSSCTVYRSSTLKIEQYKAASRKINNYCINPDLWCKPSSIAVEIPWKKLFCFDGSPGDLKSPARPSPSKPPLRRWTAVDFLQSPSPDGTNGRCWKGFLRMHDIAFLFHFGT